jgi:hypothetical protein
MGRNSQMLSVVFLLVAGLRLTAQVSGGTELQATGGGITDSTGVASTLVLGTSTGAIYDSNATNSYPANPAVQYTFNPLVRLQLDRPRWDLLLSFQPGLSYTNADLPQYQLLSLVLDTSLEFRPTERFRLSLLNTLVVSSNPFDSLSPVSGSVTSGGAANSVNLNYLPRKNELVTADARYGLNARTSLFSVASYNYYGYQNNPNLPSVVQPFQQSNSADIALGISRGLSPKYTETVQYEVQFIDAGQGRVKTIGQSLQFGLICAPTPLFRLSAMAGPEYVENSYSGLLPRNGLLSTSAERASGWTWTGNLDISETFGKNKVGFQASRQLGMGTQYQGSARQGSIQAGYTRHLPGRADLVLFGSYNINTPAFVAQSINRLSNNYSSSGATLTKPIGQRWLLNCAYWYLFQSHPQTGEQFYSGSHNRVAVSLSYTLTKPLN